MSRPERGSASLLVVTAMAILVFVGVALAGVAAIVSTHRSAQAAADLAALAAAGTAASGGHACAKAGEVARANGAAMLACELTGREALVTVRVAGPRLVGRRVDLTTEARAGPG